MATLMALVQSKRRQVDNRTRAVEQIKSMITDLERLTANLQLEIRSEEDRTKNHDPSHFAYSTFAMATIRRRDNLKQSTEKLKVQLGAAQEALGEASEELEAAMRHVAIEQKNYQSKIIGSAQCAVASVTKYAT